MSKKLITVFGATGNQGGSIISTWENSPDLQSKYAIRAITRDTSKPAAQALAKKGAEVVAADLDDADSLKHAVAGAYGVFAVTNYWEHTKKDKELAQGKAISDAAFAAGVKHFVWSSLPHTTKLTNGKLPQIDHFVAKAEVEEYVEQHKAKSGTLASYFMPGFFMSNYKGMGFINPGPDGYSVLAAPYSPSTKHPLIDVQKDSGAYVWGAWEAGSAADGKQIQAVSDWRTSDEIAEIITRVGGGDKVKFVQIPRETFKGYMVPKMGDYIAEEMTQNFDLIGDYSYYGVDSDKKQAESDEFLLKGHKNTSFEQYVAENKPWTF